MYKSKTYTIETTDGIEYIVEYPDLKACGGCGKTIAEATTDAKQNLSIYLAELKEDNISPPIPTFNQD